MSSRSRRNHSPPLPVRRQIGVGRASDADGQLAEYVLAHDLTVAQDANGDHAPPPAATPARNTCDTASNESSRNPRILTETKVPARAADKLVAVSSKSYASGYFTSA